MSRSASASASRDRYVRVAETGNPEARRHRHGSIPPSASARHRGGRNVVESGPRDATTTPSGGRGRDPHLGERRARRAAAREPVDVAERGEEGVRRHLVDARDAVEEVDRKRAAARAEQRARAVDEPAARDAARVARERHLEPARPSARADVVGRGARGRHERESGERSYDASYRATTPRPRPPRRRFPRNKRPLSSFDDREIAASGERSHAPRLVEQRTHAGRGLGVAIRAGPAARRRDRRDVVLDANRVLRPQGRGARHGRARAVAAALDRGVQAGDAVRHEDEPDTGTGGGARGTRSVNNLSRDGRVLRPSRRKAAWQKEGT